MGILHRPEINVEFSNTVCRLKGEFMGDDGRSVNYEALRKSKTFAEYKTRTLDLHSITLQKLSHEEKMAFFISILLNILHQYYKMDVAISYSDWIYIMKKFHPTYIIHCNINVACQAILCKIERFYIKKSQLYCIKLI